jgi:hypothetical protein
MTAPCLADTRCRNYDRHTQQPAQAEHTPLCRTCLNTATADINLLAYDWRDLEQLLPKTTNPWGDGQPGHTAEAPIPLRLDVEALQREIWWLTTAWAEVIADRHRLADPPHRRPSPDRRVFAAATDGQVTAAYRPVRVEHPSGLLRPMRPGPADVVWAVRILAPRVVNLARIPAVQMADYPRPDDDTTRLGPVTITYVPGAQGVLDLASTHQRARSVLGLTEPVYELPGYCQACSRPALRVKNGSDTVWCDHCNAVTTRDDYDQYGNLFLRPAEAA